MKANFYIIGSEPVIFHTKENYEPGAIFKVGTPELLAIRFKHKIMEFCLIKNGNFFTINEARKIDMLTVFWTV